MRNKIADVTFAILFLTIVSCAFFGFISGSFKFWKIWWWIAYLKMAFVAAVGYSIFAMLERAERIIQEIQDQEKRKKIEGILQILSVALFIAFLVALPKGYFTLKGEFPASVPFYYEPD